MISSFLHLRDAQDLIPKILYWRCSTTEICVILALIVCTQATNLRRYTWLIAGLLCWCRILRVGSDSCLVSKGRIEHSNRDAPFRLTKWSSPQCCVNCISMCIFPVPFWLARCWKMSPLMWEDAESQLETSSGGTGTTYFSTGNPNSNCKFQCI